MAQPLTLTQYSPAQTTHHEALNIMESVMSNKPEESVQMDALVELALDIQPLTNENKPTRLWQLLEICGADPIETMRAALIAIDLPKMLADAGRYQALRAAFVHESSARYRGEGMKIEQARIYAETDLRLLLPASVRLTDGGRDG